jgi:two-component system, LytTR family, sensor histidine kinase AlgZ
MRELTEENVGTQRGAARMNPRIRYWLRMLAANLAAALLVVLTFSGVDAATPWRNIVRSFAVAFLFATCTGPLLALTMPRLGRLVWQRFAFPFNWIVNVAVMMALAVVGSLLAITILVAIGYVPGDQFVGWFRNSLRIAIVVTLTIGISVTAYELLRARLEETTLALRTKERDEAEARRLATEAQLASLESRVQPHFLFNTLNSIAALIPTDPAGAERMTGQLASLLRSSLDTEASSVVPLEQELQTVRNYLDIERVRFGERLRYQLEVAEEIGVLLVPRMSLQTLVENSVKYAVSGRRGGGSIAVRASRHGERLRLEVEDDGPGFGESTVPPNHGLALLRERLRLTFNGRASMRVAANAGRTVVGIDLPALVHTAANEQSRT